MSNIQSVLSKSLKCLLAIMMVFSILDLSASVKAAEKINISENQIEGKCHSGNNPKLAVDGNKDTYYKTPAESSQHDHLRYLDIELDGLYELTEIKMFMSEDSYQHYQIYVSETGSAYTKVAYKDDDAISLLAEGTSHTFNTPVKASKIRINLSYNSKGMQGNLAEVEVYGTYLGEAKDEGGYIEVENFENTPWAAEYEKFETDAEYAKAKTEAELSAMVGRVLGEEWQDDFIFEVKDFDGRNMYEITNGEDGKIIVRGNDGVSLASGWNYYLRYYCNVDYNPQFISYLEMPETLPQLEKRIVNETQYDVRYALNFCTYSYTMAFWNWDEYEAFLDWAAMSGINLVLDIVGQEEIIRRTLSEYGYSYEEIKEYICGPGYFAWFYMQNLTSHGGKLPDEWFSQRVELGRKMHDRMQALGISPALSGFSGMIPLDFKSKNSDAVIVDQGTWSGFDRPDMLRVYVSDGQTDYFDMMADTFYEAQKDVFGDVTDYYAVDPFHEGGRTGDMNLTTVYNTVQNKLLEHDPDGIWVIQQWSGALNDKKLQGLEAKDHALILDLSCENRSYADVMERNQVPWVWNMLHAFGGKLGLEANAHTISQKIPAAYEQYDYMVGIGMTPESIERCPMIYELLWDMAWTKDPIDPMKWGEAYFKRRYGGVNEDIMDAWSIMLNTIYAVPGTDVAESITNARPVETFKNTSSWGHGTIDYDTKEFEKVLKIYIENYEEFKDSPCFVYDFVDIARQCLSNSGIDFHKLMMNAYYAKDIESFELYSKLFLDIIQLQNDVLATSDYFQTGIWLNEARTMIENADDWTKDLFEFNARCLITTWGGKRAANNGGLRDYSYRQWAGITEDFYLARWSMFVDNYKNALLTNSSPASIDWFNWEFAWTNRKSDEGYSYPMTSQSSDSLVALAQRVYDDFSITNINQYQSNTDSVSVSNLIKNKLAESTQTISTDDLKALTDGNDATGWVGTNAQWPVSFTYDLGRDAQLTNIDFVTKPIVASGIPVSYKVEVYNAGAWQVVANDTSENIAGKVSIEFKGIASKVRFTFDSSSNTEVPEFKEISVSGMIESNVNKEIVNVAGKGIGYKKKSTDTTYVLAPKINDNNVEVCEEFPGANPFIPGQYKLELDEVRNVFKVNVHFQKSGLRYQFKVIGEREDGSQVVLLDMSDNKGDLAKVYSMECDDFFKNIIVDVNGRASGGSYYLASNQVYEIEVFAPARKEINIAKGKSGLKKKANATTYEAAPKLVDGDRTTHDVYANGSGNALTASQFAVDFREDTYATTATVFFEKAGLRYQFRILGEKADGSQVVLLDKSDNTADLEASYNVTINDSISKLIVDLKGRASGGSFYAAAALVKEIEVMGYESEEQNIAIGKSAYKKRAEDSEYVAAANISDGFIMSYEEFANNDSLFTASQYYVDLEKDEYMKEVRVHFEKAGLRFQFEVVGEKADGTKVVLLDKSDNTEDLKVEYRIPVYDAYQKVYVNMLGRAEGGSFYLACSRLYEIEILQPKTVNIAPTQLAFKKKATDTMYVSGSKLIDENLTTHEFYAGKNSAFVPSQYMVYLENSRFVSTATVQFEKPGLRYQFRILAQKADGSEKVLLDMSDNTGDLAASYSVDVNDTVERIVVDMMGRASGGSYYLAAALVEEIEVYSPVSEKVQETENIAPYGSAVKKKSDTTVYEIANELNDEDLSTNAQYAGADDFVPSEYMIDFGEEKQAKYATIHFEKEGLRFQFQIIGEKADGTRKVLLDMSDNTDDMAANYTVLLDEPMQRIIADIKGRASGGSYYLACAMIREIEVYAEKESIAMQAQMSGATAKDFTLLTDENIETGVELDANDDKSIVMTFETMKEIEGFEVYHASEEPLKYQLSYLNDKGEWIILVDCSENNDISRYFIHTCKNEGATTYKLEVLNKKAQLQELRFYQVDYARELVKYMNKLVVYTQGHNIGDYAGNFAQEPYDALMNHINAIKMSDLSSYTQEDVEQAKEDVFALYHAYRMSCVQIDRKDLLGAIHDAEVLMKLDTKVDFAFLAATYEASNTVYDTYEVTQTQINEATQSLENDITKAMNLLSLSEQLEAQILIAENELELAIVGDKTGNVSQATKDALVNVVAAAKEQLESDEVVYEQMIQAVSDAIVTYREAIIVVDFTELHEKLIVVEGLDANLYTSKTWNILKSLYDEAITYDETNAGLHDVTSMVEAITTAIDALKVRTNEIENLVVEAIDYKTIQLTWDKCDNVDGYIVERLSGNNWIFVAQTREPMYVANGVKTGKEYTYRVKSVANEVTSEPSDEVKVTPMLNGEVELSIAPNGTNKFDLTWTAVDGATRYIVYRKASDSEWKKILTLGKDARTYTSKAMKPNTYQYMVKAARYDSVERVQTNGSNVVEGIVGAQEMAPTNAKVEMVDGVVVLTWDKVATMSHYEVYRSKDGGAYRHVKTTNTNTLRNTTLKAGSTYCYKIRAYVLVNGEKVYAPEVETAPITIE